MNNMLFLFLISFLLTGLAFAQDGTKVFKDADIVIFDGDPFEYTTHVCQVMVNGTLMKSECN